MSKEPTAEKSATYRPYREMSDEERATIPERLRRDPDWYEAFAYAPFAITDVAAVIYAVDGYNDADGNGDNWSGVFKLRDGRFGYVSAGCDYTGWNCQAGGAGDVRPTLVEVLRELCTDDDRRRFNLPKQVPSKEQ